MAETKLNHANGAVNNYNIAVVSHCPSQQTATIVLVKKPSVVNRIFSNFGISNSDKKDEKNSEECTREKSTFFICKCFFFLLSSI